MAQLFDFERIAALFERGFRIRYDAMSAITGPYARAILEQRLGAPPGSVLNGEPLEDFGGHHPDPNPAHAKELMATMMAPDAPDFGAASDGDGDRNMILGRGIYVTPSDSLAILAANAHLAPGYAAGLAGSRARCRPRRPPTGRGGARHPLLRDADRLEVLRQPARCRQGQLVRRGELRHRLQSRAREGRPVGGPAVAGHLAARREPVAQIVRDHWRRFGRNFYSRHDYEAIDAEAGAGLMAALRERVGRLRGRAARWPRGRARRRLQLPRSDRRLGQRAAGHPHPVRGRRPDRLPPVRHRHQGATLRVYLEAYEPDPARHDRDPQTASAAHRIADQLAEICARTGRAAPSVIT